MPACVVSDVIDDTIISRAQIIYNNKEVQRFELVESFRPGKYLWEKFSGNSFQEFQRER